MMEEEEPTQPATQLVMDPRRLGDHNSGLSDEDLTDIFCILHPASMPACRAVSQIAREIPEHTIGTTGERIEVRGGNNAETTLINPGSFEPIQQGVRSRDIALRLSATLKDPLGGFRFGRHSQRCDFIIGRNDPTKWISNVHFRIYITEHGVIMLEDQSTNGTFVEGELLKAKEKENGHPYKHTLQQGSLVVLAATPPEENLTFIVRIPQREGIYEEIFEQNLKKYFKTIFNAYRKKKMEIGAPVRPDTAKEGPPDIFGPMLRRNQVATNPEISRHAKEWRGGAKYNKVGTLGKGAFATVYKISAKFDGTCYAAKELEKRRFIKNGVLDQKVDTEIKIMKRIKHPNIVQFIEHVDWDDYLYLIMDYVPYGDLGNLISQHGRLSENAVKAMASQLLSALKYLHTMGITHRDVKPDNILIQKHEPFHVKLTDFGLSKMIDEEETFLQTFCGTLLYCAPEVYSEYQEYDRNGHRTLRQREKKTLPRQRYSQAVDLWSLGGVLFYALSGSPPYPAKTGTTHQQLLNDIMSKPLDVRPLQLAGVSEEGIQFVRSMLQVRPEFRLSIDQLKVRPWLRRYSEAMSNGDDDEVDMIGEVNEEEGIERGASQLSLQETVIENIYDVDDCEEVKPEPGAATPSRFVLIHSSSSESIEVSHKPRGNPRLFGEVSASALGSSGAIPQEHLNLPISQTSGPYSSSNVNYSSSFAYSKTELEGSSPRMGDNIPSLPRSAVTKVVNSSPKSGPTATSLFGAESLVGQLQMSSPSPASFLDRTTSVSRHSTPGIQESIDNLRRSLRHPREDKAGSEEDHPAPKRVKSTREIDIPLSKTIYWNPKDKSTWHNDYPVMMNSQYNEAEALAREHGEEFQHGGKIFDALIGNYRKRASEERAAQIESGRELDSGDAGLSETSHEGSTIMSRPRNSQHVTPPQSPSISVTPGRDQEFKHPRRILGKFIATSDSVIPSIVINVTEDVTSWGRGVYNTNVYSDSNEDRVPKYAFKLILWKHGLETSATQFPAESLSFWIATKARMGIKVNDMPVRAHDRTRRYTPCKYWGEIRHGDMVTVWSRYSNPSLFLRFRFECYFGVSKRPRPDDVSFSVLPVEMAEEADRFCERKEVEWERANQSANLSANLRANQTQARLERKESSSGEISRNSGSF